MAENKFVKANEEIAETVVGGYKKIEDSVVSGFCKITDKFVGEFLTHEGESVEDAKARLAEKRNAGRPPRPAWRLVKTPENVSERRELARVFWTLLLGSPKYPCSFYVS